VTSAGAAEITLRRSTLESCTSLSALAAASGNSTLRFVGSKLARNESAATTIEVGGTSNEKPTLELDDTEVTDNMRGIQVLTDGTATVTRSTVARNGDLGIESHGKLTVRSSAVIDHAVANVLVRRLFDETPTLDLGRRPADLGDNTLTVTSGAAFGLVVDIASAGVVFFAEGNAWSAEPPPEDAPPGGGGSASLATAYELSGSGYTVKF
jgi:hypothetical protein